MNASGGSKVGIFGSGVGILALNHLVTQKKQLLQTITRENTCSIFKIVQVATKNEDHEFVVFNWPFLPFSTHYSSWGSGIMSGFSTQIRKKSRNISSFLLYSCKKIYFWHLVNCDLKSWFMYFSLDSLMKKDHKMIKSTFLIKITM